MCVSDFLDPQFEKSLCRLSQRHDVVAVQVTDTTETSLPQLGLVNMQDPETGDVITVDTSDPFVRRHCHKKILDLHKARADSLKKAKVDVIEIISDNDFIAPLIAYFKRRYRR